jgi:hypothetical protein
MAKAKKTRTPKSTSTQVLTMPATTSPEVSKNVSSPVPTPMDLQTHIRQRAYEIYVEQGCTPGHETENWIQAEREILAQLNQQKTA